MSVTPPFLRRLSPAPVSAAILIGALAETVLSQAIFPGDLPADRLFTSETSPANFSFSTRAPTRTFTFSADGMPFPHGFGISSDRGHEGDWHLQLSTKNTRPVKAGDTLIVAVSIGSSLKGGSSIGFALQDLANGHQSLLNKTVQIGDHWKPVVVDFKIDRSFPEEGLNLVMNLGYPEKRELWLGPVQIYVLPEGEQRPDSLPGPTRDLASGGNAPKYQPPKFYFFGAEFGQCQAISAGTESSGLQIDIAPGVRNPRDVGVKFAPPDPVAAASSVVVEFQARAPKGTIELPVELEATRGNGRAIAKTTANVATWWTKISHRFPLSSPLKAGEWEASIGCGTPGARIELRSFRLRVDEN